MFKKASKKKQKLRLLLEGASGSGKTYSALVLASNLGKKIAFIDTEFGSASLYSDKFDFDVIELAPPFKPEKYIEAIIAADKAEYDVLIIDSISHEWSGQGGCLDIHAELGGQFNDWKKVTPRHKRFIDAILQSRLHVIGCARTKSDYAMEEGINKMGKSVTKPVKVGLKTEQREGLEFEFTTIFRLNHRHIASVSKDRTALFDGIDEIITAETAEKFLTWLNSGEEPDNTIPAPTPQPKDDTDIYIALADIKTTEELEQFYKDNHKNVNSLENFIGICKTRKRAIIEQGLGLSPEPPKELPPTETPKNPDNITDLPTKTTKKKAS